MLPLLFPILSRLKIDVEDSGRRRSVVKNIQWPSIEEFTIDIGQQKLKEYIDFTADVREHWTYNLHFLESNYDPISTFYIWEALFSIPTEIYPVAQVSVAINFCVEVSKITPQFCPVRVTFTLEGCSLTMMPGKHIITDSMLSRIASHKLSTFKQMTW